jgi:hypothetical protein
MNSKKLLLLIFLNVNIGSAIITIVKLEAKAKLPIRWKVKEENNK